MCDLLWCDPQNEPGRSPSKRGVGMQFGPDITKKFLAENGLELLIRSHEVRKRVCVCVCVCVCVLNAICLFVDIA